MKVFLDLKYRKWESKSFFRKSQIYTEIISIGIVKENGESLHLFNKDLNLKKIWNPYRNNSSILGDIYNILLEDLKRDNLRALNLGIVLKTPKNIYDFSFDSLNYLLKKRNLQFTESLKDFSEKIKKFLGDENVEFYTYNPSDIWELFINLLTPKGFKFSNNFSPSNFSKYCKSIQQYIDDSKIKIYDFQLNFPYGALDCAIRYKELYEQITK